MVQTDISLSSSDQTLYIWVDRPDRFADDADRPEHAHVPFGDGPRHCIGV
ncbi:cytochrome P450 [Natrinema saccharevitans]|nr:cytochrome P450 [Natrinema saccharevitans]